MFPYTFYPLSPQVNIFHNHGIGQNEEMNDGILLGINYSLYLGFTSVSTSSVPRSNPRYYTAFSTIIFFFFFFSTIIFNVLYGNTAGTLVNL